MRLLSRWARDFGIALDSEQLALFRVFLDELWVWNRRMNLTGVSQRTGAIVDLFLDSLMPGPWLPKEGRMLDVGSGAGFPGVPLKIYNRNLEVHLLEPRTKRVSFLKQVIRVTGLEGLEVLRGRVGGGGGEIQIQSTYDIMTSRAVKGIGEIISWCAPLLVRGGVLVGFLGGNAEKEMRNLPALMASYGLELQLKKTYQLPGKVSERTFIILTKGTTSFEASH